MLIERVAEPLGHDQLAPDADLLQHAVSLNALPDHDGLVRVAVHEVGWWEALADMQLRKQTVCLGRDGGHEGAPVVVLIVELNTRLARMGTQPVPEALDACEEVEIAAGAQHRRVQRQQTVRVPGDALVVAAERERTVGDGRGRVARLDCGGHHEARAGAQIEVRHGSEQVERVQQVAAGAVQREEGLRLRCGVEGGEPGGIGASGGAGDREMVGRDVEVVRVAGIRRGRQRRVQRLGDEGEQLPHVVEDVVRGAREQQPVVGRDEGDAVGETVGCGAGETSTTAGTAGTAERDIGMWIYVRERKIYIYIYMYI